MSKYLFAERKYSIKSSHHRRVFLALAEKRGLEPYRYGRQHRQTLYLNGTAEAQDNFWTEYQTISANLNEELMLITDCFVEELV